MGVFATKTGSQNIKRLNKKQISQVSEFSAFLLICMARCKSVGLMKLLLWYAPQYLGPVSSSLPTWIPSSCTVEGDCCGWLAWLDGRQLLCLHPKYPQGSPTQWLQWLMAWWLQHLLFADVAGGILCPQQWMWLPWCWGTWQGGCLVICGYVINRSQNSGGRNNYLFPSDYAICTW